MTATADPRGAGWSRGNPRDYDREFFVSLQVSPQLHARVPFAYRDGAQRARPAIVDPARDRPLMADSNDPSVSGSAARIRSTRGAAAPPRRASRCRAHATT